MYNDCRGNAGYQFAGNPAAIGGSAGGLYEWNITMNRRFNKFYHDCSILQADPKVREARLALVDLTQNVLRDACGLLGMECPQEM